MAKRIPLLCRLGFHTSTYSDGAMFNSASRCNKCEQWVDPEEGALVDRERKLWGAGTPGESLEDGVARVSKAMFLSGLS